MSSAQSVNAILHQRIFAVAGFSRSGKKFGNTIYNALRDRGYAVYALNPAGGESQGVTLYPSLDTLPLTPDVLLTVTQPEQTENLVKEGVQRGIRHFWLQQGSESASAAKVAQDQGAIVVAGECILMFLEPVGFVHRLHRGINRLTGAYPK